MTVDFRREAVVYHHVDEETPLITTKVTRSSFYTTDQTNQHRLKTVYSAITSADIFQKVVDITFVTSLVLFALTDLDAKYEVVLMLYYICAVCLWLSTALINIFTENIKPRKAVVFGFIVYFTGIAVLSGLAHHISSTKQSYFKYLCIIPFLLICLGGSICKTFLGNISQVQFLKLTDKLRPYTTQVYWIGHICAMFLIIFTTGIMEFASYSIGLGLCCVSLFAGLLSFLVGWNKFQMPETQNIHPIKLFYSICLNAKSIRNMRSKRLTIEERSVVAHWLDYAKVICGGRYSEHDVNEAKACLKMFMLFLTLLPYWVCNTQVFSTFMYQGFHLNRSVGKYSIPVPWMALLSIITMLIMTKVVDKLLIPLLRKKRWTFSTKSRIITGMIGCAISMALAGCVQLYARHVRHTRNDFVEISGKANVTNISEIHILWTVPQYIFHGISELFVGLTVLALACKLCPSVFKKLIISLYYVMIAAGNLVSLMLVLIGWFPRKNFFHGYEFMIFFFSLSFASLLGLLVFICVGGAKYDARLTHPTHPNLSNRDATEKSGTEASTISSPYAAASVVPPAKHQMEHGV